MSRRHRPRRLARVLAIAAACACVAVSSTAATATTTSTTTPAAGNAGTTGAGPAVAPAPGVSLVSQSPWVATGGVELMVLHLDEPALANVPGADLTINVHRAIGSRSAFDAAMGTGSGNNPLGNTDSRLTMPLSALPRNKAGNFGVAFGLRGSGVSPAVSVDGTGVYPVEVGITGDRNDHPAFVTWLVVVDRTSPPIPEPLRVSWVWRVVASPLRPAGDAIDPAVRAQIRPAGRLDHVATLLAHAESFPLTLGIGPETLESWADLAKTDKTLRAGLGRVRKAALRLSAQLLPEPYVPVSGPAIEAEGLGTQVPAEYVAGSNAVEQVTGAIPDPRTAFVDPVDDETVSRLNQMFVGRFAVRDSALEPVPEPLTPAQPFTLTTSGATPSPAVATDSGIEQLIESAGTPALRAQRVLAALAEIAYEAPSNARGIVLATPAAWNPDVATVTILLRELASDPLVRPVTLDDMFTSVPPEQRSGAALQRQLAPVRRNDRLPLHADEYTAAARDLNAYATMVGAHDPSVQAARHALLVALSTSITRRQALAQLGTIEADLHVITSGITTTAKTLTITARRASLPLSFQNDTKRNGVLVQVHLDSAKLIFPHGPNLVLRLPTGHTTVRFPVEARASGTFAMTITLESADGTVPLGPPTQVTIRSAVFSGIGVALTLGALLFLAGWWGNHFWRTRRARRRALASNQP